MDRLSTDSGDTVISLAEWQALGFDTHSITSTPELLFQNPASNNYHLRSDSPAIDCGFPLSDVLNDLEGNPRPLGSQYDIGAYEYAAILFNHHVYLPHISTSP